ncbi:MAG TPA: site-specific integrase, partial [Gallicola sp.]|nr:site-specific integrase [Gallicola sp.]
MASIRKTKAGTYQATIYVGRDANNKQLFQYVTRAGYHECRAAAREIEQEIEDNKFTNNANIKFSVYADKWFEVNKERLSPTTVRSYKTYMDKYKEYFKDAKLGKITNLHIQSFYNDLKKGEFGKKLSNNTILKIHCVLNEILEDALKYKNPARDVKAPKKE